jgi:peroxiredoxin
VRSRRRRVVVNRPLLEGSPAPDFELRCTFTETVRLSERVAAGPVVLAFYVFDFGHF